MVPYRVIPIAMLALASCYSSSPVAPREGPICTAIAVAAVNVKVLDSVSSLGLAFTNLWARASDGIFSDSLRVAQTQATSAPITFGLAYERSGTYEVTVQANGYRTWIKTGVVALRDECHVIPVALTARLQR